MNSEDTRQLLVVGTVSRYHVSRYIALRQGAFSLLLIKFVN